ncbi:penicillin acylase family protein [Flaviflexus massiliensis]|uniref:penicillin acylase family protein n=1 Tax=Flaviflexus massiliensis TaxID=1522309 RepID=UPI00097D0070|nr:penicillin acylase family protein [Flaviflexus massiliensis]
MGVPHIYANTTHDVYFAQGFNAARHRLWQLDFHRRRSLGLLAEVFGERLVPYDRAAKKFIYRGDMRAEWLAYANSTKSVAEAFTAGINAYISLIESGVIEAPLEFRALQYEPAKWDPTDVSRMRAHGLYFNIRNEIARATVLHNWGEEVEKLRKIREPERDLEIPTTRGLPLIPGSSCSLSTLTSSLGNSSKPRNG